MGKTVAPIIKLRERRTAAQVGLKLSASDLETLNAMRQVNGIVMPAALIAYQCFRVGLLVVKRQLRRRDRPATRRKL
jgi:hypothetical protein